MKKVKQIINKLKKIISVLCSKNTFLSALYYTFLDSSFFNEFRAVLAGKIRYKKFNNRPNYSSYQLRRNIHRLEKGLILENLKSVFAAGYINETVGFYKRNAENYTPGLSDLEELKWANNVLTKYFDIVGDNEIINNARKIFESIESKYLCKSNYVPYKHNLIAQAAIGYDDFYKLSKKRRSVRWYQQIPVPRDIIDKAIKVAGMSPSACNRQPFYYLIFDNPQEAKSIGGILMGTFGFSDNFPCIAVLIGDLSAYFDESDRHVIYIDGSLSAMSFMYALETLGVSSCPINSPDIATKEKLIAEMLQLKQYERVIMFISLGYPDPEGMVPFSAKKEINHLRRYKSISKIK